MFKYGEAWGHWPLAELLELETLTIAMLAQERLKVDETKFAKADIAAALKISDGQKEQNKKLSTSMADFFKGPMA